MHDGICYPPVKGKPEPDCDIRYVKYVPVGYANTHSVAVGYLLWLVGFTGAHRFYFGKPLTGLLWFCTFGLLGIGWIVDAFLIPSMDREADSRFQMGSVDYNIAWVFFVFLGWFGIHRFYQAKFFTGVAYFFTAGFFGIGLIYDAFTLNEQVSQTNAKRVALGCRLPRLTFDSTKKALAISPRPFFVGFSQSENQPQLHASLEAFRIHY